MVCHGGSIGGKSYVGLGNTQLDMKRLLGEMTRADGGPRPITTFVVNTALPSRLSVSRKRRVSTYR